MYNIKAKVTHFDNNLTTLLVIKTKNRTPEDAKQYAARVISGWDNVKDIEIIEVSTRPIVLKKYLLEIKLFYRYQKPRITKITPKGETPEEAALIADEILQVWKHWREYKILNIEEL